MKSAFVMAIAAVLAVTGMTVSPTVSDAAQRFGGGGAKMGGFGGGGRMSGPRMSAPRFTGPRMGGGNFSNRQFSGRKFSGSQFSGQRFGNINRGPRFGNSDRSRRRAGNGNWNGGNWRGGHRRYRNYAFIAAPFIAGAGYGYYNNYYAGDDCGWLRRKAIQTGSGYWWSRYEECRFDGAY